MSSSEVGGYIWKSAAILFHGSFHYQFTGQEKYLNRVRDELLGISRFQKWPINHLVYHAQLTLMMAFAYHLVYEKLSEQERVEIKNAIRQLGLQHALKLYKEGKERKILEPHHWNIVCNSCYLVAAILIYEMGDQTEKEILNYALKNFKIGIKAFSVAGDSGGGPVISYRDTFYFGLAVDALDRGFQNHFLLMKQRLLNTIVILFFTLHLIKVNFLTIAKRAFLQIIFVTLLFHILGVSMINLI